jgi:hypothetical protein
MNIYEKLSKVTEEITAVAKNLSVGYGKSSYKAVGEADVLAAVKPAEIKYGVYSFPASREIVDSAVLTSIDKDGNEKRQLFMRVKTVYRFVNMEKPEEYVDMVTYGDGVDPGDKAPGKAMTYADKYGLLKAYKIITGDDPDQKASETLKAFERKAEEKITEIQGVALIQTLKAAGVQIPTLLKQYGVENVSDLTQKQHSDIIRKLEKYGKGKA